MPHAKKCVGNYPLFIHPQLKTLMEQLSAVQEQPAAYPTLAAALADPAVKDGDKFEVVDEAAAQENAVKKQSRMLLLVRDALNSPSGYGGVGYVQMLCEGDKKLIKKHLLTIQEGLPKLPVYECPNFMMHRWDVSMRGETVSSAIMAGSLQAALRTRKWHWCQDLLALPEDPFSGNHVLIYLNRTSRTWSNEHALNIAVRVLWCICLRAPLPEGIAAGSEEAARYPHTLMQDMVAAILASR